MARLPFNDPPTDLEKAYKKHFAHNFSSRESLRSTRDPNYVRVNVATGWSNHLADIRAAPKPRIYMRTWARQYMPKFFADNMSHAPANPSPLASGSERTARSKKETLKKREAKGSTLAGESSSAQPSTKGSSKHVLLKIPNPKPGDFNSVDGPHLQLCTKELKDYSGKAFLMPDGTLAAEYSKGKKIQVYMSTEQ
jgi:hypothetical protein